MGVTALDSPLVAPIEFHLPVQSCWEVSLLQDIFSSSKATG